MLILNDSGEELWHGDPYDDVGSAIQSARLQRKTMPRYDIAGNMIDETL